MADRDAKNWNWRILNDQRECPTTERAMLAVLMDLRDELQAIRARLDCHETLAIPRYLRRISANTAKPRKRKR